MSKSNEALPPLYPILYEETVRRALIEDLGRAGDLTTAAIVPPDAVAAASIVARRAGRVAGITVAAAAFHCLEPHLDVSVRVADGSDAEAGDTLLVVRGAARPILSAERTALNFLGHLCGIATATRDIARAIQQYPTRVVCTRKTTPCLRALEKYAVRAGGGANHRFGLDDAVLVKDNHLILAGGVSEAVRRLRGSVGHLVKIEVEVNSLEQLEEALREGIDAVLLDNMPVETLVRAVRMAKGKAWTEASGGISPANAPAIAATGVDLISLGWITHSSPALDVSLDLAISL
ncbi:MAG TPA: carboxylating nicotinate-nucleotide diphosphorylase [Acidobacteriota bacterium]|nr:carboxylating nicotinate-nucleotide diphosphorylase [Acidobacteriota bacterium]